MIKAVDAWAKRNPEQKIVAQVAQLGKDAYKPQHLEYDAFYPESELSRLIAESEFVISHAGMGSIINALCHRKPIVVMPRLGRLGEHRNDHQIDTANQFRGLSGVTVADNEDALVSILNSYVDRSWAPDVAEISASADESLVDAIRQFIIER